MAGASTGMDETLQRLRILHGIHLVTIVLYAYVLRVIPRTASSVDRLFLWSIAGISAFCYSSSLWSRARKIGPAIEQLRRSPDDPAALARWRQGTILSYVVLGCVPLFGLALYFVGASVPQVAPFFVIPFVTMLCWFPKRP